MNGKPDREIKVPSFRQIQSARDKNPDLKIEPEEISFVTWVFRNYVGDIKNLGIDGVVSALMQVSSRSFNKPRPSQFTTVRSQISEPPKSLRLILERIFNAAQAGDIEDGGWPEQILFFMIELGYKKPKISDAIRERFMRKPPALPPDELSNMMSAFNVAAEKHGIPEIFDES